MVSDIRLVANGQKRVHMQRRLSVFSRKRRDIAALLRDRVVDENRSGFVSLALPREVHAGGHVRVKPDVVKELILLADAKRPLTEPRFDGVVRRAPVDDDLFGPERARLGAGAEVSL